LASVLVATIIAMSGVIGIHDLKAQYVGPGIVQASFHIEVAKGTPIEEADRITTEVEEKVSKEVNCQYCLMQVHSAELTHKTERSQ